jgi:hypothetical protein
MAKYLFVVCCAIAWAAIGCSNGASSTEDVNAVSSAVSNCNPATENCCPASGFTEVALTSGPDSFSTSLSNRCVRALGGDDQLMVGPRAYAIGGPGNDSINAYDHGVVVGGPGADVISVSGSGEVDIFDVCEVSPTESLFGGGDGKLVTPVPVAQLQALGASVSGFSSVTLLKRSCSSACVPRPDCSGHGVCGEGPGAGQVVCICNPNFQGPHCETAIPTPVVNCVTAWDDTHFTAVFGYNNTSLGNVTVPLGTLNHIDPSAADRVPPDTFAPGVHNGALLVGFDGSALTWTLGARTATATASSKRCTGDDMHVAQNNGQASVGEGATDPSAAARARLAPDGQGQSFIEAAPLPWVQSAPLPAPPGNAFILNFNGQDLAGGADANCGPKQLYVGYNINNTLIGVDDFPGCGNFGCGPPDPHDIIEANVPKTQLSVPVALDVWERDTTLCGGDDDHEMNITLNVDNTTGKFSGGVVGYDTHGQPFSSTLFDDDGICTFNNGFRSCCVNAGVDGFGICFDIIPNGNHRICGLWDARYIDSGYGEDFAVSRDQQQIPASSAMARLTLKRSGISPVVVQTPLDKDGCIPLAQSFTSQELGLALDPTTGPALTLKFELTSQFCLDPTGNGCAGLSKGAQFLVRRAQVKGLPAPGPMTICTVLTQDENLQPSQEPHCTIIKASQGAFSNWSSFGPVAPIAFHDPGTQNDVTRISGVVSQILKREVETNGELGIQGALIDSAAANPTGAPRPELIEIAAGEFCASPTPHTCADNPIKIIGEGGCAEGQPPQFCRLADDRWKFVVAHEIGHVVQARRTGTWNDFLTFNGADDPPGAPPLCSCGHIDRSNRLHCLQSIENPSGAATEAFAHLFATRVWNDFTQTDATFVYYKDLLDTHCAPGSEACGGDPMNPGLSISKPPFRVDALAAPKWRNNHCGGVPPFDTGDTIATMGTERDWMGFYYNVTRPLPNSINLFSLFNIHKIACTGNSADFCRGDTVAWDDCNATTTPACTAPKPEVGIHSTMESLFLSGAITADTFNNFVGLGRTYGISRATAP